jgi:hypothetical protein
MLTVLWAQAHGAGVLDDDQAQASPRRVVPWITRSGSPALNVIAIGVTSLLVGGVDAGSFRIPLRIPRAAGRGARRDNPELSSREQHANVGCKT